MILGWRSLTGIGVLAFLICFIAFMPAGLALRLAGSPVAFSTAEGSLWHMTLRDARLGRQYLGDLDIRPHAGASLLGGFTADMAFENKDRRGSGLVERTRDGLVIRHFSAIMDIDARFGGLALAGAVSVSGEKLVMDQAGRCVEAKANLRSDILARALPAPGDDAPVLSGQISCQNGMLGLTFKGGNRLVSLEGQGRITDGQTLVADFIVRPANGGAVTPDLQLALEFAGLRADTDGWRGRLSLDF